MKAIAIISAGLVVAVGAYTLGNHRSDAVPDRKIAEADIQAFITYIRVANSPVDPDFHRVGPVEHAAGNRWQFKAAGHGGAWCYQVWLRRFAAGSANTKLPFAGRETAFPGIVSVPCRGHEAEG